MTPTKKNAFIRKVKDISVSASLLFAISTAVVSCSEEEVYEKGIQTFITETDSGVFKIVDEKVLEDPDKSCVIVNYLSGKVDTMNIEQAQNISQSHLNRVQTTPQYQSNNDFSLGTVLLFGGAGLLMGSALRDYRYQQESRYGSSGGGYGSRYYHSSSTYSNTRSSMSSFTGSRTTRSGFFGSSSRGSSGA